MSQGKKWRDKERKRRAKMKRQPFIPEPGLSESEIERLIERKVQVIPQALPTRMHLSDFTADTLDVGTTVTVPENTITSDEITPIAGNNLLLDPSFEDEHPTIEYDMDFALWTAIGDSGMRDTSEFYRTHGGACFKMMGGASNPSIVMQGGGEFNEWDIPVEEMSPYSSTCQIMYMGSDGRAFFRIVWLDASHNEIQTDDGMKVTVLNDGMWTRCEQPNMGSPVGAKFARWQVVVTADDGIVPEYHVDSCQFEEGTIPTAFNPISTRGRSVLSLKGSLLFGESIISDNTIDLSEIPITGFQEPILRQSSAWSGTGSTASGTWSMTTNKENLLLLVLAINDPDGTPPAPTLPAGWTLTGSAFTINGRSVRVYRIENAPVKSGTQNITLGDTVDWLLQMYEFAGVREFDLSNGNTGNSTTPSTNNTGSVNQNDELFFGVIMKWNNFSLSNITNGFTQVRADDNGGGGNTLGVHALTKVVSAGGTAGTGGTFPSAVDWAGIILTFKCKPVGVEAPSTNYARIYAQDTGSRAVLRVKDDEGSEFYLGGRVGTSELPAPTSTLEGAQIYVDGPDQFAYCDGTRWILKDSYKHEGQRQTAFTTTAVNYTLTVTTDMGRLPVMDALSRYNEGWRPRVRLSAVMENNTASRQASAAVRIYEGAVNDATLTLLVTDKAPITEGGAAGVGEFEDSGWVDLVTGDFGTAPSRAHWRIIVTVRNDLGGGAGTATFNNMILEFQWYKT